MNNKKIIIPLLILLFITPFFYENYLYYQIPYNPIEEYSTDIISSSYTKFNPNMVDSKDNPESETFYGTYNAKDNNDILKYLKSLKLRPLKNYDLDYNKIDYHYYFQLSSPEYNSVMVFISSKDLSTIYISNGMPKAKDGMYKIIDGEFDYEYINKLILKNKRIL